MADYSAVFNCPGCGSPLETLEGTISLQCSYCGLIMRLGSPGRILKYFYDSRMDNFAAKFAAEKYIKKNGLSLKFTPISNRLYHLPFYRFKGMSYALYSKDVMSEIREGDYDLPMKNTVFHRRCRNFDLTIPAFDNKMFGLDSLGVRPGVMPLTVYHKIFFPSESALLDITVTPEQAEQTAMIMFFFGVGMTAADKNYLSSEMIGEGLSVIYYPVWAYSVERDGMVSTMFIDGLTKDVYHEVFDSFEYNGRGADVSKAVELNPTQHKCPNCGFDLPVSELSLYYYCANCDRSYTLEDDDYHSVELKCASHENGSNYHPFWRFQFAIGETDTVGKFSKILTGEIPLIKKSKANNPFYLYIPAFHSGNLNALTNLGGRLCRMQPELSFNKKSQPPSADMFLPESEGLELARFYWNLLRSKYMFLCGEKYDFESCDIKKGELIWLGLNRSYGGPKKVNFKKAQASYI